MAVVLCFGNPYVPEDALAIELGESLEAPGFTFVPTPAPESIIDHLEEELYVMDVAEGVSEVTLITDPSKLRLPPRVTAHDIDPALFLRLVETLYGVKVPVIALPMGVEREVVRGQLLELLSRLTREKEPGGE
ncbi:MAG: hypothetical protein QME71_09000 [Dehalococcoidia bacterium]|nr:hypothetical protein [Dehalococcoidia bacterium]